MTHANAPLTPVGRARLAALINIDGWSVRRAAERFQVSPATASRWARRARTGDSVTLIWPRDVALVWPMLRRAGVFMSV